MGNSKATVSHQLLLFNFWIHAPKLYAARGVGTTVSGMLTATIYEGLDLNYNWLGTGGKTLFSVTDLWGKNIG